MDFAFATEPMPGGPNDDHVVASAGFAIVLDGVTQLPGLDTGCVHGPRWLVRALGGHLAARLSSDDTAGLDDVLAEAIGAVCRRHAGTCDLSNPDSPSSTVAIVRERGEYLDYLVLCDSTVVFEDSRGIVAVTDGRTGTLPAYDRVTVARLRNRPGGFWVASTDPGAAGEAVTGSVRLDDQLRLLVCTDGVSRLVDHFGHSWSDVFAIASLKGPRGVIDAVRARERELPPPFKQHDDATLVTSL